jgi:hypothetical protein
MSSHTVDARSRELVEGPSRVVLTGATNPMDDAATERRRATFSSDELAAFLHDGKDNLKRRCLGAGGCQRLVAAAAAAAGRRPWVSQGAAAL